jgi:LacI family transcriptional regulator
MTDRRATTAASAPSPATPRSDTPKTVGIRDVARLAGVSTATVIRVIRESGYVAAETRSKVQRAVDVLGYTPNAMASALSSGRSNLIGLSVPDIANPFYASVAQGLEDEAAAQGYHCLVASSHLIPERERQFVNAFKSGMLAGMVLTTTGSDPELTEALHRTPLPFVFVDRRAHGFDAPLVRTNSREVSRAAVSRLIELGHTRIGMLAGPRDFDTTSERINGFRDALDDAGIRFEKALVRVGHLEERGGRHAMAELLALEAPPTAVFSFNNLLTVGALSALRDAGLRMPDDLSLVSFDDMSLFPFVDPPISAIAQPAIQMGRAAARTLIDLLNGEPPPSEDVVLPSTIVDRRSWGRPPGTVVA